jgi:hypothetical protein
LFALVDAPVQDLGVSTRTRPYRSDSGRDSGRA